MVEVKSIAATETALLRQRVLRPHQALKDMAYPNDLHEDTLHFGAYVKGQLVGIASIYHEDQEGKLKTGSWRLRGMAVDPEFRGKKIGEKLILACVKNVQETGAKMLWCNARTPAIGFYEAYGFRKKGQEFEIKGIGPHFVMVKAL